MDPQRSNGRQPGLLASWHDHNRPALPSLWDASLEVAFGHLQGAISRESRVVDIGCGEGHITQVFSRQGCQVLGIDVHGPSLQALRESYPDVSIITGDAQQLPLPSQSVDVLFSFSTFQYVDRPRALAECSRVLKPGGRFAIIENLADNPVAVTYRVLYRMNGRQYPEHLSPRHRLSWGERRLYESHFSTVHYEALHLFTPVFMESREHSESARLVRALERFERGVIRALPFARAACWHAVVYGVK